MFRVKKRRRVCWPKDKGYQFIMELLFRVMKKTWLLPPERTEAKKTCRTGI